MQNKRSSQDQFYFYNKETEQQAVDYPSCFHFLSMEVYLEWEKNRYLCTCILMLSTIFN